MARRRTNPSLRPRWGLGLAVLAAVAVVAADGVRTGLVEASLSDDAATFARDAATTYHDSGDVNAAYATAEQEAQAKGETVLGGDSFTVSGQTVTLAVQRSNATWLLGRLDSGLRQRTAHATAAYTP